MAGESPRRRDSWSSSRSDGFRPIRQVGVSTSIGVPLTGVGVLMAIIAQSADGVFLWIIAGVLVMAGLATALSNKVI
jgi:hypothetical protein